MKYQNGAAMGHRAEKLGDLQNTRDGRAPKPMGETDYIKKLKERISIRIQEKTILE
jgi:hypothetical protein